jgi:hypothetical protein
MGQKIHMIQFGDYSCDTKTILLSFIAWLDKHPNVIIENAVLFSDEGHYMNVYWTENNGA